MVNLSDISTLKNIIGAVSTKMASLILNYLNNNPMSTVATIHKDLGLEQPSVSRTLSDLRAVGAVKMEKSGRNSLYGVNHALFWAISSAVAEIHRAATDDLPETEPTGTTQPEQPEQPEPEQQNETIASVDDDDIDF